MTSTWRRLNAVFMCYSVVITKGILHPEFRAAYDAGMELLWDYAATTTDADDELAHTQCMCPRCKHVQEWVPPREWLKGGAEWEPRMVVQLQRKAAPRRAA